MSTREHQTAAENDAPNTREEAPNLLEWLYQLRDRQREQQAKGVWLIKGKDLAWEQNQHGRMKWFLHPGLAHIALRSMIIFEQEIPPGGRTGVQIQPGGSVLYILEGQGYTLLDDDRHDWQAEDVVNIPIRVDGVRVQHVNLNPHAPARFVSADINLVDVLGVDRGSRFEQLEPAPETADEAL